MRLALLCLALLAFPATASARVDVKSPTAPRGLKAFLLRAGEPASHEFDRTPSFAWSPVSGAMRYEFELATSQRFNGSAIVWSNVKDELDEQPAAPAAPSGTTAKPGSGTTSGTPPTAAKPPSVYDILRAPAVALDVALPWITGSPYALYAHVRAVTKAGPTSWSAPFGFNVRWTSVPKDLNSPYPGLVRWSPVDGATAYEVWLIGAKQTFLTTTNVADARDLYTFHRTPTWTSTISWRVRAQRKLYGEVASGLPTTTYGPWSPVYTNVQAPLSLGVLADTVAISDVSGAGDGSSAHALTPGFAFSGDRGGPLDFAGGASAELFRVYVATDKDCVNIVYRSAIVGSPAYAPRTTGPLALPATLEDIPPARLRSLKHGAEPDTFMLDGTVAVTTESAVAAGGTTPTSGSGATGSGSASGAPAPVAAATVDLPDTAWPTGGYYWTVVPVIWVPKQLDGPPKPGEGTPIEYRETELPQDVCQAGRVQRFGKTSAPVVTTSTRPFASGLSPKGRLVSAVGKTPSFSGTPLVAWQPALTAQEYEVQWSKSANPWRPVGNVKTPATSSLLPLGPGTWYYRVRGYNYALPKRPQMAWSDPVALKVAKPVFRVVKP